MAEVKTQIESVEQMNDTSTVTVSLTGDDETKSSDGKARDDHLNCEKYSSGVNCNKHDVFAKNGIVVPKGKDILQCDRPKANSEGSSFCSHTECKMTNGNLSNEPNNKQDCLEIDLLDSGVHSGADNCSDGKSSSSSPILSTQSSIHDLCEKTSKTCVISENKADSKQDTVTVLNEGSDIGNSNLDDPKSSSKVAISELPDRDVESGIEYVVYESEIQMPDIMKLITKDLSEPYSIYTYRYFIHNWPKLCFLAMDGDVCVGAIVCKLDMHKKMVRRGYIAMLAVDQRCRRKGIGSHLVLKAIEAMIVDDCDEVVLETEITNKAALHLYENLGFVRDKRLFRYYLNGVDALRLKLWLR